jgi:hypothetical protein
MLTLDQLMTLTLAKDPTNSCLLTKMDQLKSGTYLNINQFSQDWQQRTARDLAAALLEMMDLLSQGGETAS